MSTHNMFLWRNKKNYVRIIIIKSSLLSPLYREVCTCSFICSLFPMATFIGLFDFIAAGIKCYVEAAKCLSILNIS